MRKIMMHAERAPEKKLEAMHKLLEGLPAMQGEGKIGPVWLAKVREGSVAILTRTNGEAIRVAKMLLGDETQFPDVPVCLRLAGERPVVPAWVALLLGRYKPPSFTRSAFDVIFASAVKRAGDGENGALQFPAVDVAWRRLARASGAPDTTTMIVLEKLREHLDWPDSFPDDQIPEDAGVYVTNIHQAKGMEFDNVSLLETTAKVAEWVAANPQEEANVCFVAITRAGRQLGRIPASAIYPPPFEWESRENRKRFVAWGKMNSMQIGLPGDIDATSFVNAALLGGEAGVENLQNVLAQGIKSLRGHKVILKRVDSGLGAPGKLDLRFDIHLQNERNPGLLLARTSQQVTRDLLQFLGDKGYVLPGSIFNLRIADVVTMVGRGDIVEAVPDPWRSSRIWLGISLSGTGDYKAYKKEKA